MARDHPARGDGVVIVSSPFGLVSPVVFQNSVTTGIVSNVMRWPASAREPCLYLTDARCLPGSEGGPVFDSQGGLIGMVLPTLERGDQSSIELGAVIPLPLFREALGLLDAQGEGLSASETAGGPTAALLQPPLAPPLALPVGAVHRMEEAVSASSGSVVLICVNSSWGSGVLVSNQGHILSCAHLFRPFTTVDKHTKQLRMRQSSVRISVTFRDHGNRMECGAKLLFCCRGPIDVALIKIESSMETTPIRFVDRVAEPGQPCIALGHAIFDPAAQLRATASAGVVSRVVAHPRDPAEPAILQTCASVFRGHSGGLLADSQGRFLGILTSNARHSNGSIIPTINFSIPYQMLQPLIASIAYDDDQTSRTVYEAYNRADPQLLALWRLEVGGAPPLEHDKLDPSSRFSEFLDSFGAKL
ncbi:Glyoxysomal processing protease [Durusdinium trenchii]|uniref:Glyoxysomal (AtDEG15) (DEG-protease) n=1 Tax=Durusdinium trenchii TaxID=1381693 RepID=A0ABP0KCG0_9DINO